MIFLNELVFCDIIIGVNKRKTNKRKPDGYWRLDGVLQEENIKNEKNIFVNEKGILCSAEDLEKQNFFGHAHILREEGVGKIAKILGVLTASQAKGRNPSGTWTKENIINLVENFIEKNKRFPSEQEANAFFSGLGSAMRRKFGSIKNIAEKIGKKNIETSSGNFLGCSCFCENSICFLRSKLEIFIHSFMIYNKINHKTDEKIVENLNYKYDFYLLDYDFYIEIFGLSFEDYLKTREEKIEVYKKYNKKLLKIEKNSKNKFYSSLSNCYAYIKNIFEQEGIEVKSFSNEEFSKIYLKHYPNSNKEFVLEKIKSVFKKFPEIDGYCPNRDFLIENNLLFIEGYIKKCWGSIEDFRKDAGLKKYKKSIEQANMEQSFYEKGFTDRTNKHGKSYEASIRICGKSVYLSKCLDPIIAFVVHKVACRAIHKKRITDKKRIKQIIFKVLKCSKNSIERYINVLKKDPKMKDLMIKHQII